jgi:predicted O-methyltransferase YrrM
MVTCVSSFFIAESRLFAMNPVLEKILSSGVTESEAGELLEVYPSAIPREEGEFLQEIISDCKPVSSLEVGLAFGVSALFICEALSQIPNAHHIILDPYQFISPWKWKGSGLRNLVKAGYGDIIEFRNELSHLALPELEAHGTKLDFAFVDGSHKFDYVLLDFFYIDRMLRPGGIIAFDDAVWPSVRKFCRFLVTNRSYNVFRCFPPKPSGASWRSRMLRRLGDHSQRAWGLLSPELLRSVLTSEVWTEPTPASTID